MQITLMGYLLMPLGLVLFSFKKKYLLYFMIFFSGFTGSSVLQVKAIDYSLQPAYYFGILLIIKYILEMLFKDRSIVIPNKFLLIFMVICSCSLIMPFILERKGVLVLTPDNEYSHVVFNLQNITQYLYLMFCFFIYWIVKDYVRNDMDRIHQVTKVLLYSGVIICLMGFYQEIAYIKQWPFDEIFRSGVHGNVQPYGKFIRVYAVAGEPSMYAVFLAPLIALVFFIERELFKYKRTLLVLLLVSGILSTSTSFVFGMFVFIVLLIADKIVKKSYNKNDIRVIKTIIGVLLLVGIISFISFVFIPQVKQLLTTDVWDKISGANTSGSERIQTMLHHLFISIEYPLLGVGFGAARTKDLLTTLLVNIGYIGTSVLVLYVCSIYTKLVRLRDNGIKFLTKGYSYYLIILFLTLFISVPEPYYLFIWISLAVSECLIKSSRLSYTNISSHSQERFPNENLNY